MNTRRMKQLVFTLLAVALLLSVKSTAATASLKIEDFTINGGETKTMLIDLENPDIDITLVQFDMRLPEGLSIDKDEDGFYIIDITERTTLKKHNIGANDIEDGLIRVLLASPTEVALTGNSGAIISIQLTAATGFTGGEISLENIKIVVPDVGATTIKPSTYTYTVTTGIAADDVITFADAEVKRICVANWDTDGDGELSKAEAAAVTNIGQVFKNNSTITSFDEFQYFTGVKEVPASAFYYCTKLESIKMPSSITNINGSAFGYCRKLTSVGFPNNEGFSITNSSFVSCSALSTITLPKNLLSMTGNPFINCYLTEINVDTANPNYKSVDGVVYTKDGETIVAYPGGNERTAYSIASGTKYIGDYAFNYSRKLQDVSIPSTVIHIGTYAFIYSYALASVAIPNSVTSIGGYAFGWCNKLASLNIANSVYIIGDYAFWNCESLTAASIPSSVTWMGNNIFGACINLASINVDSGNTFYDSRNDCNAIINSSTNELICGCKNTVIPTTVISIGDDAFYSATGLTSITIPGSVKSIGYYAFGFCERLAFVAIPSSVTSIGANAFYYCLDLTTVRSMIEQPFAINENAFLYYDENYEEKFTNATLYVPKGTKTKYEATDGWKNFKTIVEMNELNGDVNGDMGVDEADIASVISVMAGGTGIPYAQADVNGDGKVDVADIVAIISEMRARARRQEVK